MAKNYLFLSRREYGETDVLSVQNSGFFEQLTVTNTGYIVTSSEGSCRMQMQLRLTYYMPK